MKVFGFVLSILPILILGFYLSYESSYRIKDLRELKKVLTLMKNEIVFLKTPLRELIEHMKYKSNLSHLFHQFLNELNKSNENIYDMWERAVHSTRGKYYFKREDEDMLLSLGKALGKSTDTEISTIENIMEYIDMKILELNEEKSKDLKLYKSLSVLFSALIIILFL